MFGAVVIATKPMHLLQIRPTVHNYKAEVADIRQITSGYVWQAVFTSNTQDICT